MATLNRKLRAPKQQTHEGAPAVNVDALAQLDRSVMSCLLWEDEFYEDGQEIGARIKSLVAQCKPEDVAGVAIEAKKNMRLRHVPLLLARELARTKEGRKQLKNVIPEVITRADDIPEILAIYFADTKKVERQPAKLANQLKKHLGESFNRFDEYQLAKYNGGKKEVSLKDALRLTHPKASTPEQSDLYKRLLKDELKTPDTWEVEISASKDKKESWTRLLKENKLGGLAMLRNLRNMREAGIEDKLIKEGIAKINAGRLLPINFISAAKHNPQFEESIEKKFFECFDQKQKINGKTILLVDISPSMDQKLSARSELSRMDVGFSLSMIAREMFSDVRIFSFSNNRVEVPNRRGFGLKDAIKNSQQSNGTMLGAALRGLPAHDRLIVLTDEQSQDAVPQMKGYMINVASARNGVGYHTWVHIDGWSDRVLNYLVKYEQISKE